MCPPSHFAKLSPPCHSLLKVLLTVPPHSSLHNHHLDSCKMTHFLVHLKDSLTIPIPIHLRSPKRPPRVQVKSDATMLAVTLVLTSLAAPSLLHQCHVSLDYANYPLSPTAITTQSHDSQFNFHPVQNCTRPCLVKISHHLTRTSILKGASPNVHYHSSAYIGT